MYSVFFFSREETWSGRRRLIGYVGTKSAFRRKV